MPESAAHKTYMKEYYKRNKQKFKDAAKRYRNKQKRSDPDEIPPASHSRQALVEGLMAYVAAGGKVFEYSYYVDMKPREVQIALGNVPWPSNWPKNTE